MTTTKRPQQISGGNFSLFLFGRRIPFGNITSPGLPLSASRFSQPSGIRSGHRESGSGAVRVRETQGYTSYMGWKSLKLL
jgi:hypothetical protein